MCSREENQVLDRDESLLYDPSSDPITNSINAGPTLRNRFFRHSDPIHARCTVGATDITYD